MTAAAQLGILQAATETETDYGGRVLSWTDVANLWVSLAPGGAAMDQQQDQRPVRIETATAAARDHPAAAAGQQLVLGGPPWRVLAVQRPGGGRMLLTLDRQAYSPRLLPSGSVRSEPHPCPSTQSVP